MAVLGLGSCKANPRALIIHILEGSLDLFKPYPQLWHPRTWACYILDATVVHA